MQENQTNDDYSDYQRIEAAIAHIAKPAAGPQDWAHIAKQLQMNERQLVRLFERWCGLSPKGFAQAVALDHAKRLLADKNTLLDTSFEVGLSSTSRLYDLFVRYEAMPPGTWAAKGEGLAMQWGVAPSPFGPAMIFWTEHGVAGIGFVDDPDHPPQNPDPIHPPKDFEQAYLDLANRWPNASFQQNDEGAKKWGKAIFDPRHWDPKRPVRLILIGSEFEVKVWEKLIEIPFGGITTYGDIAHSLNKPSAARAVGTAVGKNPISFVVPCHRVVGSTGSLTGYHWGVMRKRAILGWESGHAKTATNPKA